MNRAVADRVGRRIVQHHLPLEPGRPIPKRWAEAFWPSCAKEAEEIVSGFPWRDWDRC